VAPVFGFLVAPRLHATIGSTRFRVPLVSAWELFSFSFALFSFEEGCGLYKITTITTTP
jgi:hypothetical protein